MRFVKKLGLLLAVLMCMSLATANLAPVAYATAKDEVCKGVNLDGTSGCADSSSTVNTLLKTILNIMSWVAGIITIIMVIIAGIKFTTSGGDSSKVTSARGTITYALVGAVIVILAQVIVRFVLTNFAK